MYISQKKKQILVITKLNYDPTGWGVMKLWNLPRKMRRLRGGKLREQCKNWTIGEEIFQGVVRGFWGTP